MEEMNEVRQLKSQVAAYKKEIKALNGKLKRSQAKNAKQTVSLKKKEKKTIEIRDEQLQSLLNQLPDINIKSLLFD